MPLAVCLTVLYHTDTDVPWSLRKARISVVTSTRCLVPIFFCSSAVVGGRLCVRWFTDERIRDRAGKRTKVVYMFLAELL